LSANHKIKAQTTNLALNESLKMIFFCYCCCFKAITNTFVQLKAKIKAKCDSHNNNKKTLVNDDRSLYAFSLTGKTTGQTIRNIFNKVIDDLLHFVSVEQSQIVKQTGWNSHPWCISKTVVGLKFTRFVMKTQSLLRNIQSEISEKNDSIQDWMDF